MHPYHTLSDNKFWKTAVANRNLFDIDGLWAPKFKLEPHHKTATFGSCFAQHIGKALQDRNYSWLNTEPAPEGMLPDSCKKYNYNIFSCRPGNIYTTSLLKQWVEWALEKTTPPSECWEQDGRFYDPFRPNIEPDGFQSEEEMILSRQQAIRSFRRVIDEARYFIFTLGLTESWFNKKYGYEYPMCPGVVAGEYDAAAHVFNNQQFGFVKKNLVNALTMIRAANPDMQVILTVSPVPLTATYSENHVLVATMLSKSILRAVAGQLAVNNKNIDYFPAYEIINSSPYKGIFFEPNQRTVSSNGVDFVMDSFFDCLHAAYGFPSLKKKNAKRDDTETRNEESGEVCEEVLLEAFKK